MDVRGQGALEYLLLIGGAVLVAAIVIALITGVPSTNEPQCSFECSSFTAPAIAAGDDGTDGPCSEHVMSDIAACLGSCVFDEDSGCYYLPA